MSSVIFQPLLHDPLGWKASNSTYTDHYKWRKYRSTSKGKKISTYGQQYQRELQKQPQPNQYSEEQTINPIIVVENNQERPITYRYSPSKTPVYIVEYKQRPITANVDATSGSRQSQRPPTVEEKPLIDPNNDDSRHWLTYPNPKTPQYIIDIKQRLNQLKIPSTLARPSSASNATETPQQKTRPLSASTPKQQANNDQHHFLTFNKRETPDDLRAARYRLDKHRYNPSLDSYPPRPQTSPIIRKPTTPPEEFPNEPKTDAWVVDDERKSTVPDNDSSTILVQMVDCDGLPNEYVDALETSNVAQVEYQSSLNMNAERRPDNPVYRLSSALPENKNDSFVAYQNHQQSTVMNNQLRQGSQTPQNNFGVWVRNATEKERASAMKLLQDVLHQPVIGYDNQTRQRSVFKQAPMPPPARGSSATRKLGRTRTQHQFPCEICEKLLIKRHVWDLSGSETLTCPHHPQGTQVRT